MNKTVLIVIISVISVLVITGVVVFIVIKNNDDSTDDDDCAFNTDCAGVCGGNAIVDECGECGGSGPKVGTCDCDGNVNLGCGCGVAGPSGCDNICDSTLTYDVCGVCGGDGIADGACDCDGNVDVGCGCGVAGPSGCDNICDSTLTYDVCGVCGGPGKTITCSTGNSVCNASDCPVLDSVNIMFNSDTPIAQFQFDVTGVNVTDITTGDAAAAVEFNVTGNNTVLGYSFQGATIPAGEGVLVVLNVTGDGNTCLENVIISDSSGNSLNATVENCTTISIRGNTVPGCTELDACNYNADATVNDESCEFAQAGYDCEGNCVNIDTCLALCYGSNVDACNDLCNNGNVEACLESCYHGNTGVCREYCTQGYEDACLDLCNYGDEDTCNDLCNNDNEDACYEACYTHVNVDSCKFLCDWVDDNQDACDVACESDPEYCPVPSGCVDATACNYDANATVDDGNCCYNRCLTMNMADSYGDGWNGATYTIYADPRVEDQVHTSGTLSSGSEGSNALCLDEGDYTIVVGGGDWGSEISWYITDDVTGNIIVEGSSQDNSLTTYAFSVSALEIVNFTTQYYDASNAVDHDALINSNNLNYRGTGYWDPSETAGDYITFEVTVPSTANYMMQVRYALGAGGGAAPEAAMQLVVNGDVHNVPPPSSHTPGPGGGERGLIHFEATNTWNNYANTPYIPISLNAGNNTVTLQTVSYNGPNIDGIYITCFEMDIDYDGYDVQELFNIDTAESCQEKCQENSLCNFWSYRPEVLLDGNLVGNQCWLKSSDSGRTPRGNRISGRRYC